MSSIHNSKAPSRSSSNPAKAPPQSKKILIQQAPSLGSPGSSLATAGGTATINHPVQRPSPKAGSASPRPSRESSSQRMRHFRESRSPQGEREVSADSRVRLTALSHLPIEDAFAGRAVGVQRSRRHDRVERAQLGWRQIDEAASGGEEAFALRRSDELGGEAAEFGEVVRHPPGALAVGMGVGNRFLGLDGPSVAQGDAEPSAEGAACRVRLMIARAPGRVLDGADLA